MEIKREKGHQDTGGRRGVLEMNCARAAVCSYNHKETEFTVRMSGDDSGLEDRFIF